ncbi:MAG: neutral/alkaline non-lysosomal ceramidase N-terminal domain-containing protein [Clostridia bacterium]|nr:neutral/alkaline non-lysosomal ceramidase N-terminal domain-containing protein [Clostridia bacterium]
MKHLLCGAAERVITPRLGLHIPGYFKIRIADAVKTDLKTHALVLDDGKTQLAIIHIDIIDFQASLAKRIRKRLQEAIGIDPKNVMIAATHTHTGQPSNYSGLAGSRQDRESMSFLIDMTVEAVLEAYGKRVPVSTKCAFGKETNLSFNRNYHMTDGTIVTNPGKRRPFEVVGPISPIDHTVGVIRFDDANGTPVAQLVNFACHPDTVGGTAYCADYPGELCRIQQERFGKDFVTVYLNGASGNVNHINAEWFKQPNFALDKAHHYIKMGETLSKKVFELHEHMEPMKEISLDTLSKTYRTERRQPTDADFEWSEKILQSEDAVLEDQAYARELLALHKRPVRYANVEIQAFRIGDCAIATLPCEAYADIALNIRKNAPFEKMMISSLTNGTVGYVVTEPAFSAGVYESRLSKYNSFLPPQAADEMANCALALLKKLC